MNPDTSHFFSCDKYHLSNAHTGLYCFRYHDLQSITFLSLYPSPATNTAVCRLRIPIALFVPLQRPFTYIFPHSHSTRTVHDGNRRSFYVRERLHHASSGSPLLSTAIAFSLSRLPSGLPLLDMLPAFLLRSTSISPITTLIPDPWVSLHNCQGWIPPLPPYVMDRSSRSLHAAPSL